MSRSRRGVSLTELLVVMSASTVVLTLSSALVCRVMRVQVESRSHADAERDSLRLSEQFRRDAHLAEAAVTNRAELGGDGFVRLQLADGQQVDYSLKNGVVRRSLSAGGKRVARDEFKFPAGCEVSVRQDGTPSKLTLALTSKSFEIRHSSEKHAFEVPSYPVSLQVESILGRDLRFASPGKQGASP
jgi:hypothetical protein